MSTAETLFIFAVGCATLFPFVYLWFMSFRIWGLSAKGFFAPLLYAATVIGVFTLLIWIIGVLASVHWLLALVAVFLFGVFVLKGALAGIVWLPMCHHEVTGSTGLGALVFVCPITGGFIGLIAGAICTALK